jgi:hypothetical protein
MTKELYFLYRKGAIPDDRKPMLKHCFRYWNTTGKGRFRHDRKDPYDNLSAATFFESEAAAIAFQRASPLYDVREVCMIGCTLNLQRHHEAVSQREYHFQKGRNSQF